MLTKHHTNIYRFFLRLYSVTSHQIKATVRLLHLAVVCKSLERIISSDTDSKKKKATKKAWQHFRWYISDTLAEEDKRRFNHRSPAVISFLPVIAVVRDRPLCSNSLCLTSSDDRILLIHSTWSGLLVPRGINTRSITSNQTLITFSALTAIGWHVTCYCKVCLASIDSNDQTTEAFLRQKDQSRSPRHITRKVTTRAACSLKLTRLVLVFVSCLFG